MKKSNPFRSTATALVVHLVLLGASATAQSGPDGPRFPTLASDLPVGSGLIEPCLDAVEGSVECGRFRVFEDRAAAQGRTLDLAFMVARALEPKARARDAVTFLLGGPGSSATAQAGGLMQLFRDVRRTRDLVFLDLRGVGASGALSCDVPYPGGVASRFDDLFPVDHVEACAEELSQRARLDQYTSGAAMDDLDDLRKWLSYSALNFYTGSYGTREVQVFLRRHPDAARTVVLNAPSPIFHKPYLSHARGLQNALDRLVAECASSTDCHAQYPALETELRTVLAKVKRDPPTVTAEGEEVAFGAGALGYALRGLLYRRGQDVPYFVHQAAQGNWQSLADYFAQRQAWVARPGGETGFHFSVICAESIGFVTDDEVRGRTADTFLGDFLIEAYRSACRAWPHARLAKTFLEPVKSRVPTLIFSGERDPVTPPSKGAALAEVLVNSRHVVVPNGGHGVFGECYQNMIVKLIETASVAGLDESCVVGDSTPTAFRAPDD